MSAALLLLVLPACGPPPPITIALTAPAIEDEEIVVAAIRRQCSTCDDEPYLVRCNRGGRDCRWTTLGSPEQSTAEVTRQAARSQFDAAPVRRPADRRAEALVTAARDHACTPGQTTIQSDATVEGVEGYWIAVCRAQRFYQWSGSDGGFVDRTPEAAQATEEAPPEQAP